MALTTEQRNSLVESLAGTFPEDSLEGLTDNQLVALDQPEELDNLIELATNSLQAASGIDSLSDDDLTAELARRKTAGPTGNALSEDEFLAQAPPAIRELVLNARAAEAKAKKALVAELTANCSGVYTATELEGMSEDMLTRLKKLTGNTAKPAAFNFGGRGVSSLTSNSEVETPLIAPTLDFKTK